MALKRENVGQLQALKKELHESNRLLRMTLPRYDDKVKKIGDYVLSKLEESERRRTSLTELQDKLKQFRREHIDKLIRYIFPISQAISNKSSFSSSDGESKNTINEISDATRTAYVRGKWVLQDSFGEIQHIIVAPALPGNGNYSAYNDWATVNPATDVSSSGRSEDAVRNMASRNPAHTIAAALTYTAQLVQIMCFYLDIRLPYKVSYSDFCTTALSEAQFNRKVARLNANILYLCYTQGCRLNELRPTHTLENVQRLMNSAHADLGRFGPMDRNFCLNEPADAALTQHLGIGEDSDSDGKQSSICLPLIYNSHKSFPQSSTQTNPTSTRSGKQCRAICPLRRTAMSCCWPKWLAVIHCPMAILIITSNSTTIIIIIRTIRERRQLV